MRIADHIAAGLRERGIRGVMWGDDLLVDLAGDHIKLANPHPLNVMAAACSALDRAPDIFKKTFVRAHDGCGRPRVVRCFRLKK